MLPGALLRLHTKTLPIGGVPGAEHADALACSDICNTTLHGSIAEPAAADLFFSMDSRFVKVMV